MQRETERVAATFQIWSHNVQRMALRYGSMRRRVRERWHRTWRRIKKRWWHDGRRVARDSG